MPGTTPTVVQPSGGGYAWSHDLLPGAVRSAVGYASSGLPQAVHRGLPSPYLTFILSLDAPIVSGVTAAEARSPAADRNDIVVAGLHAAPTYVLQTTTQAGIQLAVHPLAARMIFGAPASRVPWQVTEGVDLMGAQVGRLRERLLDQPSWQDRFDLVAAFVRERAADADGAHPRPELAEAWRWLARRRGAGSMDELARHVNLSSRQLRTLFGRELGVGPKQLSRLMRFDAAKETLATVVAGGHELNLTDLASRCGYYDHPHLVAEFRTLAGASPTEWLAEERRNIQVGGHRHGEEWSHDHY